MDVSAAVCEFRERGYYVLKGVISDELREAFWAEVRGAVAGEPDLRLLEGNRMTRNADREPPFGPLRQEGKPTSRITDIEFFSQKALELALHTDITAFLAEFQGTKPSLLQTLTYAYSSEQGAHSDRYLVNPRQKPGYDRDTLAAAWFAIEASSDENGALILWPGSHKIEKPRLDLDFSDDYTAYTEALTALLSQNGIEPVRFYAEAGDVLFWHGDLVHAGGPILEEGTTRRSFVCHYGDLGNPPTSEWWQRKAIPFGDGFYFKRMKASPLRKARNAIRRRLGG